MLLDSKIQKDPIVYKLVQQMKGPVAKVSEVRAKAKTFLSNFNSFFCLLSTDTVQLRKER